MVKVYTTILAVTGISVQPGATDNAGKSVRDVVVTGPAGELVLRLVGETRDDLQVTFAGGEQGNWKATMKRHRAR